jgi:hypothetical protein
VAYKELEVTMPQSHWVAGRVSEIQDYHEAAFGEKITDPTRLAMIAMRQNALYSKENPNTSGSLTLPRHGALMHRGRPN